MFLCNLLSAYYDKTYIGEDKYYLYDSVWTDYANNFLVYLFLYLAIALAVILIGVGIFVKLKKAESLASYIKVASGIACGFVLTVIVTMLTLEYAHIAEKGYADYDKILGFVLVPMAILGGVAVLGVIASYIASLFSQKSFKITLIVAVSLFAAALVALLVCLGVYLASGSAEANNEATISTNENILLYVSALAIIIVIGLIAFFCGKGEKKGFDSKSISYAAVCIASSFALSYIKFIEMPQGGSITLVSLLPLMIYSYMYGVRKGVLAGAVYGVLQAVQDPWIIHPAQFLLDYPVAFAAIGVAGMFTKLKKLDKLPQVQFALGAVVAAVLRFASHVLSGVFAFSEYSTLDNVWAYSMAYNSFVFVDIAITIIAGVIVFSVKSFVTQVKRVQASAVRQCDAETAITDDNENL